ncbi:hypothetical protein HY988_02550 [Candidatus Micrarchaeota archaeon]|nr:hypothetical protein [Candidatus Micrarchaeota archaeon]
MVRRKTPLLLVFGMHAGPGTRADVRFFREAAKDFIDRRVIEEGRNAVWIPEWGLHPERLHRLMGDEEGNKKKYRENLSRKLNLLNEFTRKVLEKTIDAGTVAPSRFAFRQQMRQFGNLIREYSQKANIPVSFLFSHAFSIDGGDGFSFGLGNMIRGVNSEKPGRIITIPEAFNVVDVLSAKKFIELNMEIKRLLAENGVAQMTTLELIRTMVESDLTRDKRLQQMIEGFSRKKPDQAIIVTRGHIHRGMTGFFDPERYDITVKEKGLTPDFLDDAVTRSYTKPLSDEEFREYAELQTRYYQAQITYPDPLLSLLKMFFIDYAINLLGFGAWISERSTRRARQITEVQKLLDNGQEE